MKRYLRKTALLIVVFAMLTRCSLGQVSSDPQYWEWSKRGQPHHASIVTVQAKKTHLQKDWFAVNGVYIKHNDKLGVLTVNHILTYGGQIVRIVDQSGNVSNQCNAMTRDKFDYDIAFIQYRNDSLTPLELSDFALSTGSKGELVSIGGPVHNGMRNFYMTKEQATDKYQSYNVYTGFVISGDSGAPILNDEHKIVGIQSGGTDRGIEARGPSNWPIYRGATVVKLDQIRAFLDRIIPKTLQAMGSS